MRLARADGIARSLGLQTMRLYTNKLMGPKIARYRRPGEAIEREKETAAVGTVVHTCKTL